jgi:hypothetical protein
MRAGSAPIETTGVQHRHRTAHHRHGGTQPDVCSSRWASLPSVRGHSSDELNAIAVNAAKAEKELDWKPTVDLAEGTRRTIRWLCATLERESLALLGAGERRSRATEGIPGGTDQFGAGVAMSMQPGVASDWTSALVAFGLR